MSLHPLNHNHSPQQDQNIFMGYVTSSPQSTPESDTTHIAHMRMDFSQQENVPTTFVLEDLTNHLAGELSFDHNQQAYVSD